MMEIISLSTIDLSTVLVFVCTFLLVYYSTKRQSGVPPGPKLFPVVGNIPQLASGDLLKCLADLRKRYGDIYGLYIGKDLNIFLNGHSVIHDALVKRGASFLGRPRRFFDDFMKIDHGIIMSIGKKWKDQRRFTQSTLQELCFKNGGLSNERTINDEISHMVSELQERKEPLDLEHYINISIFNAVCRMLLQYRFEFKDQNIRDMLKLIRDMAQDHRKEQTLASCLPFPLDYIAVKIIGLNKRTSVLASLQPLVDKIRYSEEKFNGNSFVSLYLKKIEENKVSGTIDSFTEVQMNYTIFDMIVAGSETTANTLRWILLYLIREPKLQEKIYEEISRVIGKETPSNCDRANLPYTEAVILEGLRIQSVAPLAVPHAMLEDTIFHGYLFPKNSTVMVNISSINLDPELWPEPTEFRPERFLNEDHTKVQVAKEFIPFSLGQRSCLGETFARVELFLYLTTLVQTFQFLPEVEEKPPTLDGTLGITWSPCPFKVQVVPRNR